MMMIAKTPWIERKFNFDYPVSHFPVFLERLRGTVPHVEDMVKDVAERTLKREACRQMEHQGTYRSSY